MKKFANKIFVSIICLLLVLSMAGCSLFVDQGNGSGLTNPSNLAMSGINNYTDTGNGMQYQDSNVLASNTSFVTQDDNSIDTMQEAANLVKRSVVKIELKQDDQTIGYGSGVIVDIKNSNRQSDEYYIITAHHVISSQTDIAIYVPDENSKNHGDVNYNTNYAFEGTIGGPRTNQNNVSLIGGDKNSDIAVLKLDINQRPVQIVQSKVAPLTRMVDYAEEVFAVGNPAGELPMTFLDGHISYVDREVYISSVGYMTLLQHNCMITHGSSGGGLYNLNGQLIGITNAGSDEYKGMNYAVPFYGENGFVNIAKQLISTYYANTTNYGYVSGRWALGIQVESAKSTLQGSSVKIANAFTNGHCSKMQAGDYIGKVSFGNNFEKSYDITSLSSFTSAMTEAYKMLKFGDQIKFTYYSPQYYSYTLNTLTITLANQMIFCDTNS